MPALARQDRLDSTTMERVLLGGDLSQLSPAQRVSYYLKTCESLGLNPLTKPFDYINLNGKLTLYARKDCADQLRRARTISIDKPEIRFENDWIIVTVTARDSNGRTDADVGVVNKKDMRGDYGNALMKAVTKAKRRVTLSICGLGITDESETDAIPGAKRVVVDHETGEILEDKPAPASAKPVAPKAVEAPKPSPSPAPTAPVAPLDVDNGPAFEEDIRNERPAGPFNPNSTDLLGEGW